MLLLVPSWPDLVSLLFGTISGNVPFLGSLGLVFPELEASRDSIAWKRSLMLASSPTAGWLCSPSPRSGPRETPGNWKSRPGRRKSSSGKSGPRRLRSSRKRSSLGSPGKRGFPAEDTGVSSESVLRGESCGEEGSPAGGDGRGEKEK